MATQTILGLVSRVIDGDTFQVRISGSPSQVETIRIRNIDAPELPSAAGIRSMDRLHRAIYQRTVELTVYARDEYGRLVCDVRIVHQ